MINGLFISEKGDASWCYYRIKIKAKETAKSFVLELLDFHAPLGEAPQMESFFRKSERVMIKKNGSQHAIQIWNDGSFTLYPYRAGVPYYFRPTTEE